jgi:hypothetical protein
MFAIEYDILKKEYKGKFFLTSTRQGNRSLPNTWR